MLKDFCVAMLFLVPLSARACTCDFAPIGPEEVRNAKHIIVFRLLSASMAKSADNLPTVRGQIAILTNIRGPKTRIKEIQFVTTLCCGSRLDIGNVYALITSTPSSTMIVNAGNLIELKGEFKSEPTFKKFSGIAAGTYKFDEVFPRWLRDRLDQQPMQHPCKQQQP